MVTSRGLPPVAGLIRSSTSVPGSPLIFAAETSAGSPAIDLPSTASDHVAALDARRPGPGLSSSTVATRRPCLTSVTVRPTPENSPDVAALSSSSAFGPK